MSKKSRTIEAEIITAMRENNWLRNDPYTLKAGFTGDYDIEQVVKRKSGTAKTHNNFAVQVSGASRRVALPGGVFANARVVDTDTIDANPVNKGSVGVFYRDDISDVISASSVLHEHLGFDEDDFILPEGFRIVGAVVDKDPDGDHPRVPLRRYKNYSLIRKHHADVSGDDGAYLTRDLLKEYLSKEGADRIKGLPTSDTTLQLPDSVNTDDMSNWTFTLLIKISND